MRSNGPRLLTDAHCSPPVVDVEVKKFKHEKKKTNILKLKSAGFHLCKSKKVVKSKRLQSKIILFCTCLLASFLPIKKETKSESADLEYCSTPVL